MSVSRAQIHQNPPLSSVEKRFHVAPQFATYRRPESSLDVKDHKLRALFEEERHDGRAPNR